MTRNHNDQADDLFTTRAREWTPASMGHIATVLYAPRSNNSEFSKRCASVLSDDERTRARRFLTKKDAAHFIERRAFRRYCGGLALKSCGASSSLSEILFEETEKGRPFLPGLPDFRFSFSACKSGYLGAWSSTHGIGVDIEDQSRKLEAADLAQRFFSQAEAKAIEGATAEDEHFNRFYKFWCLKEAALKSIGEGLPFGLDAFEFTLTPALTIINAPPGTGGREKFDARLIEQADHCAALVIHTVN